LSASALRVALGAATLAAVPLALEFRIDAPVQPLTQAWQHVPIEPRRHTALGISFRTPQVAALGLETQPVLKQLLEYPFERIRLGAYWNRVETAPGVFNTAELDAQVESAERAGKHIILCAGALKTFGYPEFFVPAHHLDRPLPEHTLITPHTHAKLLAAAADFLTRIVERYKSHQSVIAWQVEHEAVDPLGVEHSWRLSAAFVECEVQAVRAADPARPVLMNGYLPVSTPVRVAQWWQTRDQGDSLDVAQRLADIVGIDYYPRHALLGLGPRTLYLDGSRVPWQQRRRRQLFAWAGRDQHKLMVSEGQAEPWEAVTTPPNPPGHAMYSCPPEQLIANYNRCMAWSREAGVPLEAYLFWGAEYWSLRHQSGDSSYLNAFNRILCDS
jgi:Beta-galactosidase